MKTEKETKIINKILDAFHGLRQEIIKLKAENRRLKKDLKATEDWLSNRVKFLSEEIKENERLKKENEDLKLKLGIKENTKERLGTIGENFVFGATDEDVYGHRVAVRKHREDWG